MSVRPIDRFIGALHRDNGDELIVASGRTIRIRFGGVERNVLAQQVRTHQIENLVAEAVPADMLRRWRQDGELQFPYNAPSGPVMFHTQRNGGQLAVSIKPYAAPAATAGPEGIMLESPLDEVMSRSDHGMQIVAGQRASDQPSAAAGGSPAPQRYPAPSAPIELEMESICPAPLPSDAYMPVDGRRPLSDAPMEIERTGYVAPSAPTAANGPGPIPMSQPRQRHAPQPSHQQPPQPRHQQPPPQMPVAQPRHQQPQMPVAHDAGQHHAASDLFEEAPVRMPEPMPEPMPPRGQPVLREVTPPPAPAAEPAHQAAPRPRPSRPARRPSTAAGRRPSISARRSVPTDGTNRIDPLLRTLVQAGGSDLHLTANMRPMMRLDGDMQAVPGYDEVFDSETIERCLMEVAAPQYEEKFYEDNDADYAHEIQGVARFRVNAFLDRRGVGGVMRVIPSEVLTADQLGLPPVVRTLCQLDKGMVLVTGPTGSGKSTTLAAMIDLINKTRTDHIITIEDPVEFVHEPQSCLINQREVYSHTKSFNSALKAALREDPDIVLVGEMRDLETISIAIETAETGHLVFGTLHTNTAVSTIDRIIDQFPADREKQIRVMMSEALRGVIAQTLCKKIGGGRVAALEILVALPSVANLIREGKTFQIPSIIQTGKAVGMITIAEALTNMVKAKTITPEEAFRRSINKNEMRTLLERLGHRMAA